MNTSSAILKNELNGKSWFSALYSLKEVLPGLVAMFCIAIFSNRLVGVPNPFTLHTLFAWLDGVIGPINHQPFFQILNSNFVWNPLLLGLIIGNVFGVPDSWKRGLSYIHLLMPLGIIMLAPHFMVGHAFKIGVLPILICTGSLFLTATVTLWVSRLLKLDDRHGAVIAGGLSTGDPHVCAILMPLVKAKGGQVVNAFVGIIVFGLIAMQILPIVGDLVGIPAKYFGLASVVGVGNGAQAVSTAFGQSYEAGRWAGWFDIGRHVFMPAGFLYVFIVMFIRKLRDRHNENIHATRGIKTFPIWLGVFVFLWILTCLHVFKEPAHHAIFEMVRWDFSLAAAALGLSLSFRDIGKEGVKGFFVTCIAGIVRIVVLLAVILLCVKTGLLPA
ncbi:putative sulfate exporter family transporter [Pseudodesulfovibrio sp. JC047]|uniref:putative sulfate exporter family transporter n=1 Tax=Pseudodesulfovibrio sp. JC047 TaxID=2683199 RepID=UPI0013D4D72C|nr:putative sulfate exporter family transporter [Pseudodesulfovibrio sp. JC047]NDV19840.1 putative sulfate exporter family transporter [Pseudodesulfovibrio sp. JC047]